eukprot:2622106-Prymnesium_polylepis.1
MKRKQAASSVEGAQPALRRAGERDEQPEAPPGFTLTGHGSPAKDPAEVRARVQARRGGGAGHLGVGRCERADGAAARREEAGGEQQRGGATASAGVGGQQQHWPCGEVDEEAAPVERRLASKAAGWAQQGRLHLRDRAERR